MNETVKEAINIIVGAIFFYILLYLLTGGDFFGGSDGLCCGL